MKSNLTKQTGSGLVGILIAIFIIAAAIYGSSFYWGDNTNINELKNDQINVKSPVGAINALDQAKEDIGDIQNNLDKQAESIVDPIDTAQDKRESEIVNRDSAENRKITVASVQAGGNLISPVLIEGIGVAMDNILMVELRNSEHETMIKEPVSIKSVKGKSGPFKITLSFEFGSTKEGYLAVYEENQIYRSELNLVEIPVKFNNFSN